MLELLNKFAWFLSFALCFAVSNLIFWSEIWMWAFMIGAVAAVIVKGFVFPKDYILSRLLFFKRQILKWENISENTYTQQERVELESDDEIDEPYDSVEVEEDTENENIYLDTPAESQNEVYSESNEPENNLVIDEEYQEEIDVHETPAKAQYAYQSDSSSKKSSEVRELNMFEKFFAENLLAKVWGIFVFLGVLFLLGLVYTMIGPITKLILWFVVWGMCYISWVWLDKKWYIEESRIVLWIALLINYLVILWGRYYLWSDDTSSSTILSVGITFFFLIVNTVLAIVTSQVYNSRPLLIFAFIVAYINPFLLWESSSEPYTLLGYTMIVTLGAMFMAYRNKDEVLFPLSFVFAAILILIAPWSDASWWVTKLLCINSLSAIWLYVSTQFRERYKFGFEILISGTFFLIWCMWVLGWEILSPVQYIVMWASSLWLMGLCYIAMHRWVYLYSIWTVGTILTLTPVILQNWLSDGYGLLSALIVIAFWVMNIWITVLQPKKLLGENIRNTISGLVSGSLFLILMVYVLWNQYFTADIQGFLFFGLSIIYAGVAYVQAQSVWIKNISINKDYENLIYSIFSLWISLFTLAVAFVFAENKAVVSIAWLLEANVLFYLAARIKSQKVALLWIVLLIIWVVKFIDFTDITNIFTNAFTWNYGMLISFAIIFVSYVLNLVFIKAKDTDSDSYLSEELAFLHHIFHILGMWTLLLWGHQVIGITDNWISLLYYSTFIMVLWVIYEKLISPGLQKVHLIAYLACMWIHILLFFNDIWTDRLQILLSTLIAGIYSLPFVYDYVKNEKIQNENLFYVFIWYILTLSSLYLYHIFGISLVVTSYWGIIVFSYISFNIKKNNIVSEKSIGMYIVPMAIVSALFYQSAEIWAVLLSLQALLLFFYAHNAKNQKNAILWLIIMIFGVLLMKNSLMPILSYSYIIAGLIILLSMLWSLLFTQNDSESWYLSTEFVWSYNIVHAVWMIILAIWGHDVLWISSDWSSLLYYWVVVILLWVVYEKMSSMWLQKIHLASYILMMGTHIMLFADTIQTESMNLTISSLVVWMFSLPFIYDYFKKWTIWNKPLFIVFLSYLFILSSLYIYQIFGVTFMVTLYWWVLAFAVLWFGIARDILAVRTIGLYLITLTATKVFLYDIWMSVDDTVSRVIALIVVWILMIVLSTMYTKKFGNNLNSEFKLSNLFPKDNEDSHQKYKTQKKEVTQQEKVEAKSTVQKDIEKIDVSEISGVKLTFNGDEKAVQIRAENLLKIAKLITNTYKKTEFAPWELEKAYKLIESDYKSELSPAQYTKIRTLVKRFVDEGGSIELVKK